MSNPDGQIFVNQAGRRFEARYKRPGDTERRYAGSATTYAGAYTKAAAKLGSGGAPAPETPAAEPTGRQWVSNENYTYNSDNDTYVTFLRCVTKPVIVPGKTHRAMKQAYSNWDGQPATINEICRRFSFPRPWFIEYRQAHGWTHDQEPFTSEELLSTDVDQLVDDALQQRRQALYQQFEAAKWQKTKQDADKWRKWEQTVLVPLYDSIARYAPAYVAPVISLPPHPPGATVLLSTADLHFGKYGHNGQDVTYSREIARARLLKTTEALLARVTRYGAPGRFLVVIGGDDEHVDNSAGMTTGGTPQDMDGTPEQMSIEYGWLLIDYLSMICQAGAPVDVYVTPGNHNRYTALLRAQMVQAWFRNSDAVTVHLSTHPRQYVTVGDTLVGLAHGDGEKLAELGPLMATEAAALWGASKHRLWFVQHLHHEELKDVNGVKVYRMPSLSGSDRWHTRKGYTMSQPGAAAYVLDEQGGICATLFSPAVEAA